AGLTDNPTTPEQETSFVLTSSLQTCELTAFASFLGVAGNSPPFLLFLIIEGVGNVLAAFLSIDSIDSEHDSIPFT
ncbi:hypothetical protein VIGAN_09058800, partial [Vigna angularis var. angularis]